MEEKNTPSAEGKSSAVQRVSPPTSSVRIPVPEIPFPQAMAETMKKTHPAMYRYSQKFCDETMERIDSYENILQKKPRKNEENEYENALKKSTEFWGE
jgi:hypothetical protein